MEIKIIKIELVNRMKNKTEEWMRKRIEITKNKKFKLKIETKKIFVFITAKTIQITKKTT